MMLLLDFSYIHGGSVRTEGKSRYRQWMTHKLASWIDQFGTSGCVGCGRCITWCPTGIDITAEAAAIRANPGNRRRPDMEGLERIVLAHPFFTGLDPKLAEVITGCVRNHRFDPGQYLFMKATPRTSSFDPAWFSGVGDLPPGQPAVVVSTEHEGAVVGVSWLVTPYQLQFHARARELVRAIGVDAKCLRDKCEADIISATR